MASFDLYVRGLAKRFEHWLPQNLQLMRFEPTLQAKIVTILYKGKARGCFKGPVKDRKRRSNKEKLGLKKLEVL